MYVWIAAQLWTICDKCHRRIGKVPGNRHADHSGAAQCTSCQRS
jgi:hypothetical protein